MAEPVSADEVARNLRLTDPEAGDLLLIGDLAAAARRACEHRTGRTVSGDEPTIVGDDLLPFRQAVIMLASHWYANREGVSSGQGAPTEMPMAVQWLLEPLRKQVA